jgi:hypothetical protein
MNVGQLCRGLILKNEESGAGLTNEALALKAVEIFKNNGVTVATSASCIAWYKNKMRKEGIVLGKSATKSVEIDMDSIEL